MSLAEMIGAKKSELPAGAGIPTKETEFDSIDRRRFQVANINLKAFELPFGCIAAQMIGLADCEFQEKPVIDCIEWLFPAIKVQAKLPVTVRRYSLEGIGPNARPGVYVQLTDGSAIQLQDTSTGVQVRAYLNWTYLPGRTIGETPAKVPSGQDSHCALLDLPNMCLVDFDGKGLRAALCHVLGVQPL